MIFAEGKADEARNDHLMALENMNLIQSQYYSVEIKDLVTVHPL